MKRAIAVISALIWLIFFIYLLLPAPTISSFPDSLKSTEPGDTVQIPGVSAYYTDWKRAKVVKFYQEQFGKSPYFNLPLFQITLNHPVEYSRQVIRDPFLASYFEEVVHPFRESLFIAGWEPENAPAQLYSINERLPIIVGDQQFFGKVTLRTFDTNVLVRLILFSLVTISGVLVFQIWRRILATKE